MAHPQFSFEANPELDEFMEPEFAMHEVRPPPHRGARGVPIQRLRIRSVPRAKLRQELGELDEFDELDSELIGSHPRNAILTTTDVPFRWICRLELNLGDDPANKDNVRMAFGTGVLVGPRHVLTAGHNLFDQTEDTKSVRVIPGYNCAAKNREPFGSASASRSSFNAPKEWRDNADAEFDYGLITLSSDIGNRKHASLGGRPLGYWGSKEHGQHTLIEPKDPGFLTGTAHNLCGYPGDKCCLKAVDAKSAKCNVDTSGCPFESDTGAQFHSFGRVVRGSASSAPRLLLHDMDTCQGNSGSPIWLRWKQFRNLVGIHTGAASAGLDSRTSGSANRAVRITDEVMRNLRSWMGA